MSIGLLRAHGGGVHAEPRGTFFTCTAWPAAALPSRSTLYKLLRCTCLHCFKLRMAGGEVERFRRRLQLLSQVRQLLDGLMSCLDATAWPSVQHALDSTMAGAMLGCLTSEVACMLPATCLLQGRLVEAQDLVVGTSAAAKKAGGEMIDDAELGAGFGDLPGGAAKQFDYDVAAGVKGSAARAAKGARRMGLGTPLPGAASVQQQPAATGGCWGCWGMPDAAADAPAAPPVPQAWARAPPR